MVDASLALRVLAEAINKNIFPSGTVVTFIVKWFCLIICIFHKIVFCLLVVPDVLKIDFSTIDLLYNGIALYYRIMLYDRTITSLVLFIFTGVIFGVFDIIYFRLALKALDIGRFCCECDVKRKYELKFYLWRAPTLVNFIQILQNFAHAEKHNRCTKTCRGFP